MTASEAREHVGKFGRLEANGDNYPKILHGHITDVDRTMIEFTDNFGFIHLFKTAKVINFEPLEFKNKTT
jgi:hypothetical protein